MTKYFVWTSTGPQIIYDELPVDGSGNVRISLRFTKKLEPDEENLTLDELVIKYQDRKEG